MSVHICGIQKNGTDNLFAGQEQRHRCGKQMCGYGGERDELGDQDLHIYTTMCKIYS